MSVVNIICLIFLINSFRFIRSDTLLDKTLYQEQGIAEFVPNMPRKALSVTYPKNNVVNEGNLIDPGAMLTLPVVSWDASKSEEYVLLLIGLDEFYKEGFDLLWLVAQIPGDDVQKGHDVLEYRGTKSEIGYGEDGYRYLFLVYKQPKGLTISNKRLPSSMQDNISKREAGFNLNEFVEKFNLGDPVAGNYFILQSKDI